MFGVCGLLGNIINYVISYWVGNYCKWVFVEVVDVVFGIGYDKVDLDNLVFWFVNVYWVVFNLGVFDFGGFDYFMWVVFLYFGVMFGDVCDVILFEVYDFDVVE